LLLFAVTLEANVAALLMQKDTRKSIGIYSKIIITIEPM
jgi:hypothetical protein